MQETQEYLAEAALQGLVGPATREESEGTTKLPWENEGKFLKVCKDTEYNTRCENPETLENILFN